MTPVLLRKRSGSVIAKESGRQRKGNSYGPVDSPEWKNAPYQGCFLFEWNSGYYVRDLSTQDLDGIFMKDFVCLLRTDNGFGDCARLRKHRFSPVGTVRVRRYEVNHSMPKELHGKIPNLLPVMPPQTGARDLNQHARLNPLRQH